MNGPPHLLEELLPNGELPTLRLSNGKKPTAHKIQQKTTQSTQLYLLAKGQIDSAHEGKILGICSLFLHVLRESPVLSRRRESA
jgi:hypothetical protein